jgi:septal ring factor EnvC (AmiA/AmiB activator)
MRLRLGILALAISAVQGCQNPPPPPSAVDSRDLRIDQLTAEKKALQQCYQELADRSGQLAKELARQKFIVSQMEKQLSILGDTVEERDHYRGLAQSQAAQIQAQQQRIAQLEKSLGLPPGSAPASPRFPE